MVRWLVVAALLPTFVLANDVPLDRDPANYLILGMKKMRLKNYMIVAPGCNIGVNCAPGPSGPRSCGKLNANGSAGGSQPSVAAPGQVAANRVCATGSFFQVFNNSPSSCVDCANISHPGMQVDCTDAFTPPILGDLDGDMNPSCDETCTTDLDDIALACGVTLPFPPCDPGLPVLVAENADCSVGDAIPGNARCDLTAGTYGRVTVNNGGRLDFAAGTTVICGLRTGNAVRITANGPATVLVPGAGRIAIKNSADVGVHGPENCGTFRIVTETGRIRLGRRGDYSLDACSLAGKLKLGHSNNHLGHFLGDRIGSDFNSEGRCCSSPGGPAMTTTTSTTVTTTSTSSSTSSSSSSTSTSSSSSSSSSTSTSSSTSSTSSSSTTSSTSTSSTSTSPPTTDPGQVSTSTVTTSSSTSTSSSSSSSSSTSTSSSSTSSTTSSSSTSSTTSSTSTSTSSSTSSTTVPGAFTRTAGFYKNHPTVTQQILTNVGSVTVCGKLITDVDVDHGHSALEGLCVTPLGDQRVQLVRQLITAALNLAAGGAPFGDFAACNTVCQNPAATPMDLTDCVDVTDDYNQSGDNQPAPFDPPGSADPNPCQDAFDTVCTVLAPGPCAAP